MPTVTLTKTYVNGNILVETDLDNLRNSLTTFVNTILLDNTNIQAGGLVGSNLATATIGQSQIGSGAVGTAQISSSGVQAGALAPFAISTPQISLSTVGNTQIGAKNYVTSSGCGLFRNTGTLSSSAQVVVTNMQVSLTTAGRPVWLGLIPDGVNQPGSVSDAQFLANIANGIPTLSFYRGTQMLNLWARQGVFVANLGAVWMIDYPPSSGTYSYSFKVSGLSVNYASLMAYEL